MILIKAQRDALLKPLQTVTGIVERRHTLPILSNVLISKNLQTVSFCSTDIEMQIRTSSEMASGDEPLSTTVAARKLLDILRALPEQPEITVSYTNKNLSLAQGKAKFSPQTLPAEDAAAHTKTATAPGPLRDGPARYPLLLKWAFVGY